MTKPRQILNDLLKTTPRSASVHALLGDVQWEQNKTAEAVASFRRAVELAPNSELASLGLFHTLMESGDKQQAIAEMERFMSAG